MALNPDDTLLNSHYCIQRQLGRGGFGFVYLAQDALLDEEVAIKELIPALVGDESMLKRFLAEARATMRLTNKRIVRTHNVFSEGGNYYIVMEYMAGGSLEERLRARGTLPVEDAVRIAAEVCEGLACAHEQGVVHCDLKPHNILFDAEGGAKVADFGIAHVSGEMLTRSWMTPAGFVAGTLPYMSPEQTDGVRDEPRIDVYALGAVLYRALTGQTYLSFDPQETPRAQAQNVGLIYSEEPAPPSEHNRGIPAWLDGVVLRALAKQPEARHASAEALRTALLRRQAPAEALPPTQLVSEPRAPASPSPAARRTPSHPAARAASAAPAAGAAARSSSLPAWFWPAAGAAVVLFAILIVAIGALGRGRDGGDLAGVVTPTGAMRIETAVAARTAMRTAAPTAMSAETSAPTARPTATSTSTPVPPTSTPSPPSPEAGRPRTRSKDGMVMVYVPAGAFEMGSADDDSDGDGDEKPQHTVTLDAFWIDRTEVTNAQYARFLNALGGHQGRCGGEDCIDTKSEDDSSHILQQGGQYVVESGYEDHPMIEVSWYGAQAYCEWVGARLPTEAEWEKAAQGTDGRKYPWGNEWDVRTTRRCNFSDKNDPTGPSDTVADDGYAQTAPVGSYPDGASPYGALDMAGNVLEWVADWYHSGYYANSPSNNPKGPNSGDYRVLRGGSWGDVPHYVRAAYRYLDVPTLRYNNVGLRCCGSSAPGE